MKKLRLLKGVSYKESEQKFSEIMKAFQDDKIVIIDESDFIIDYGHSYLNDNTELLIVKNVTKNHVLERLVYLASSERISVNKKYKQPFYIKTPTIQASTSIMAFYKLGDYAKRRIELI